MQWNEKSSNAMDQKKTNTMDHHQKHLHIAPMLDVSKREFRALFRILSNRCVLWTDMVVDETIVFTKNIEEHLGFDNTTTIDDRKGSTNKNVNKSSFSQHPIICQIGGSNPDLAGDATRIVEQYQYDEINLNCECPSNKVSKRNFGAVLMKEVEVAVKMVQSMSRNVQRIPVSVKARIGVDDQESMEYLVDFIGRLRLAGCHRFVIHARKVFLNGISPANNRVVPPLNYPRVFDLCDRFPDCSFVINGGIPGLRAARLITYGTSNVVNDHPNDKICEQQDLCDQNHLGDDIEHKVPCMRCNVSNGSCVAPPIIAPHNLRGCMLGRAAMDNPAIFWDVDRYFYGEDRNPCQNRRQVLLKYCEFLEDLYPRRCCDNDSRLTGKMPAPIVIKEQDSCNICQNVYGGSGGVCFHGEIDSSTSASGNDLNNSKVKGCSSEERNKSNEHKKSRFQKRCPNAKITSRVVDRALKPVHGICFGMPNSRKFRRDCDRLSRDMSIRNCGPGFILRKVMECMSDDMLDQDFVKTENLADKDVVSHFGPRIQGCN